MALLAFEGFENAEPLGRAGLVYAGGTPAFVAGRSSGSAFRYSTATATTASFTIPNQGAAADRIYTASAAVRLDAIGLAALDVIHIMTPAGAVHVTLRIQGTTGAVALVVGSGATSTINLVVGEWVRLDLRAFIDNSIGWAEAWVNGVKACEVLNADTQNNAESGHVGIARFSAGPSNNTRATIDDVYCTDSAGAAPYNGRLGDVRIESLVPNGNGSASQFVGSDGNSVDNYLLVDELPASSTDYVASGSVGDRDLYTFTNLTIPSGSVHAVQMHALAAKTDTGAASLIPVTRLAGVEHEHPALGLGTVYAYGQSTIRTVDPSGNAWTVANVNAAEFGVEAGA